MLKEIQKYLSEEDTKRFAHEWEKLSFKDRCYILECVEKEIKNDKN